MSQKNGIITLIPKSKDAAKLETVEGWRPISLLNVDYKWFTKILANRMKYVLNQAIGENQKCALPGRQITDLTKLYSLIYEQSKNGGSPLMFIQIDQKAAFDLVHHKYMFQVLAEMGLHGNFLESIKACYQGCTAQVLVNGVLSSAINIERGIRQGCPLSMLLYVAQLEPVLRWISKENRIIGFKIDGHEIKYGAFADDTTIILSEKSSMRYLMKIWDFFGVATGSQINKTKTTGLWVGKWNETPNHWYNIAWKADGLKILGTWIGNNSIRARNWEGIEEKIAHQVNHFKGRQLTIRGRIVAWNTYIISKYRYRAVSTPVPPIVRKKIDRQAALFVWKKAYEPMRRTALTFPRTDGGLGLISLTCLVDALRILELKKNEDDSPILACVKRYWMREDENSPFRSVKLPASRAMPDWIKEIRRAESTHRDILTDFDDITVLTTKKVHDLIATRNQPIPRLVILLGAGRVQRIHRSIFKLPALPAVRDLLFHIVNETVPTGRWLEEKGIYIPGRPDLRCASCLRDEDLNHLFLLCPKVMEFWRRLPLHPPAKMDSLKEDIERLGRREMVQWGCAFLAIWRIRNKLIFHQVDPETSRQIYESYISLWKYHQNLEELY